MRVVLDTNFWVSYLISRRSPIADVVDIHLALGDFDAVTSPVLLEELERVLQYPKLQRYYDPETRLRFVALVAALSELVDLPENVPAIYRHPADDWVIATAVAGDAEIIVSGNKHLLELERVEVWPFDELVKCDEEGVLKDVRDAIERKRSKILYSTGSDIQSIQGEQPWQTVCTKSSS